MSNIQRSSNSFMDKTPPSSNSSIKVFSPFGDLVPDNIPKAIKKGDLTPEEARKALDIALVEGDITEEVKKKVEAQIS